ncbi:MAG TPA: TonB C-terminal domain-containing protein [Polyangiaceae bacterium]|nr:TonB C-terminal domain-containing protein [Polyangiaceae bacterium]
MARDPNIPLFLWVAAAIVAHLVWGGGAEQVAEVFEERADMRRFAASVQQQLRRRFSTEIALLDDATADPLQHDADEQPPVPDAPADEQPADKVDPPKQPAPEQPPPPDDVPAPEREKLKTKVKPEPEKQQKPKEEVKPKPEPEVDKQKQPEAPKQQQPQSPQRVAVVQHVDDKNQADNPEAEFLGDDANRVQEQTQARITATDQDNEKPSPGSQHMGPTEEPGDSHVDDVAQSDDSPGEINRAPSEDKLAASKQSVSVSQPQGIPEVAGRVQAGPQKSDPGEKGQTGQTASRAETAMDATHASPSGDWQLAHEREERLARAAREARRHRPSEAAGNPDRPIDFLGLGAEGRTERGVNLNLSPGTALAAIGQDQLAREIRADGERRRSKHQGSWKAVGIERWRPAIENYVATVKLGNQTALNTAAAPFATYLNRIHNRLHPIFAVNYLGFLDGLPGSAGLHDKDMKTNLEIVLSQSNGSIVKMGVTRTSGVTAFDISALESVQRASPFGAPPPSIVSPDGNVYLHWEFHRNPLFACSTYFARPYIIKVPQKSAPPRSDPPAGPFGPEEEPPPAKQGSSTRPTPYASR